MDSKNNTGDCNTGDWNTGNCNTWDCNTGDWNTGNRNTGNCNTGDCNTGDWNTGNRNTGDWNTGNCNTGNCNTGDWNTGNCNTGNRNTGNRNTGNWNTGDWNTGYCNTDMPPVRIFGKDTSIKRDSIFFPSFFYYTLTEWVSEDAMCDKEKEAYPSYVTCRGYLKCYTVKTAWRNSWDKASDEDRRKALALPNWNNEMFKEISGIDVEAELAIKKSIMKEFTLEEISEKLGIPLDQLRIKD